MNRMFKIIPIVALATILVSAAIGLSAELMLTGTVDSVTQAIDDNGASYTRVIVTLDRTMEGTEYKVSLPVMAFGDQAAPAAALAAGDTIKAIAQNRVFEGRESYTILKLLE